MERSDVRATLLTAAASRLAGVVLGGLVLFLGIGIGAGHFAARFHPEHRMRRAVIAAGLVSAAFLGAFRASSGHLPLLGGMMVAGFTIVIAALAAGTRGRTTGG